jgi:hypothetical protein
MTDNVWTIDQLTQFMTHNTGFVELNLPNVEIPSHMSKKIRKISAECAIRFVFNNVTTGTIESSKIELHKKITEYAGTPADMMEMAEEMLQNFMISEDNIDMFLPLIQHTHNIKCPTDSRSIGIIFLNKCGMTLSHMTSLDEVTKMASMDTDGDLDQTDKYNKICNKIACLIKTICLLYMRPDKKKLFVASPKLTGLVDIIITNCIHSSQLMDKIGDPYDLDQECEDETEFFIQECVRSIYIDHLILFMEYSAKTLILDPTVTDGKTPKQLLDKFHSEIVPMIKGSARLAKIKNIPK